MADLELSLEFGGVSRFAWAVYKSCQDAGWAFDDVARVVIALHTKTHEFEQETKSSDWKSRLCAEDTDTYPQLPKNCMQTLEELDKLLVDYKKSHVHRTRRKQWGDAGAKGTPDMKTKLGERTTELGDVLGRLKPVEGRVERVSLRKDLLDDLKGRKYDAPANMAVGVDTERNGVLSPQQIWANLLRAQMVVGEQDLNAGRVENMGGSLGNFMQGNGRRTVDHA